MAVEDSNYKLQLAEIKEKLVGSQRSAGEVIAQRLKALDKGEFAKMSDEQKISALCDAEASP